ncbi:hypothetical protein PLAN_40075 [Planktothrix rubescens CCAP 1459/22]|uniref:Uncharacterized protein n=1 Tax=Planktothrix rubescens CCAP 1459/22 TaxID=329571 RepID=A0A6J7ZMA6_PLARU|nr:hypothetical protein PLAN_40075 [Planktothrix rubescens NIVA-CYA 18]CAD0225305.1 hypothetical protein PL10110_240025 [Planktothrix agardhii]
MLNLWVEAKNLPVQTQKVNTLILDDRPVNVWPNLIQIRDIATPRNPL